MWEEEPEIIEDSSLFPHSWADDQRWALPLVVYQQWQQLNG